MARDNLGQGFSSPYALTKMIIEPDGGQKRLCSGCEQIQALTEKDATEPNAPSTPVSIYLHPNFAKLEECADRGCSGCQGIWKLILRGFVRTVSDLTAIENSNDCIRVEWASESRRLIIRMGDKTNKNTLIVPHSPKNARQVKKRKLLLQIDNIMLTYSEVDTDLMSTCSRLRSWISNCSLHERCVQAMATRAGQNNPTRLIDLFPIVKHDKQVDIKLVDTEETMPGTRVNYCALSYCWGGGHNFGITTTSNLAERLKGFSSSSLPKTIQDVFNICRNLAISYVWVDALCIVQDDRDDWNREAPRMQHVYGNSGLCISAVSASHADEGLLHHRANDKYPVDNLRLGDFEYFFSEDPKDILPLMGPLRSREFGRPASPIFTRAWTLQEAELSPRILYWTLHGLVGSCQQGMCGESEMTSAAPKYEKFSQLWEEGTLALHTLTPQSDDIATSPLFEDRSPAQDALEYWKRLREMYGRRLITVAADRLPAIGGIASLLREKIRSDYFAGFWELEFPNQLLWKADQETLKSKDERALHSAPSWSWASLPNTTLFTPPPDMKQDELACRFIGCNIQLANQNQPFGAVTEGQLVLQGPLLKPNVWTLAIPRPFIDAISLLYRGNSTGPEGLSTIYMDYEAPKDIDSALQSCSYFVIQQNEVLRCLAGIIVEPIQADKLSRKVDILSFKRIGSFEASYTELDGFNLGKENTHWTEVCII